MAALCGCAAYEARSLYDKALWAESQGDYEAAQRLLAQAQGAAPGNALYRHRTRIVESKALAKRGRQALQEADFETAVARFDEALAADPGGPDSAGWRDDLADLKRAAVVGGAAHEFFSSHGAQFPAAAAIGLEEAARLSRAPSPEQGRDALNAALSLHTFYSNVPWVPASLRNDLPSARRKIEQTSERSQLLARSARIATRYRTEYETRPVESPNPEYQDIQSRIGQLEDRIRRLDDETWEYERDLRASDLGEDWVCERHGVPHCSRCLPLEPHFPRRVDRHSTFRSPSGYPAYRIERQIEDARKDRRTLSYQLDLERNQLAAASPTVASDQTVRRDIPYPARVNDETWEIRDRLRILNGSTVLFERSLTGSQTFEALEGHGFLYAIAANPQLAAAGLEFLAGFLRSNYEQKGETLIKEGKRDEGCERLALFCRLAADLEALRGESEAARRRVVELLFGGA